MKTITVATNLSGGVVVDKSKLNALGAAEMAATLGQVYASGKPVVIVDNAGLFFSPKELIKRMEVDGEGWALIAEFFDITISDVYANILQRASEIKSEITDRVKAIKVPYDFAKVPDGWSVDENIQFTASGIVRRINSGSTEYSIGSKALEGLWNTASKVWAKIPGTTTNTTVKASGYTITRSAVIYNYQITIGCQIIHRHEIEQIAVHKGWAFPEHAV